MKEVVGYLRTAIDDPTEERLYQQKKEIIKYCEQQDCKLSKVFYDNGVPGSSFERKGWQEMKDYLARNKGKIDAVVLTDFSRMSRNYIAFNKERQILNTEFGVHTRTVSLKPSLNSLITTMNKILEVEKPVRPDSQVRSNNKSKGKSL